MNVHGQTQQRHSERQQSEPLYYERGQKVFLADVVEGRITGYTVFVKTPLGFCFHKRTKRGAWQPKR